MRVTGKSIFKYDQYVIQHYESPYQNDHLKEIRQLVHGHVFLGLHLGMSLQLGPYAGKSASGDGGEDYLII